MSAQLAPAALPQSAPPEPTPDDTSYNDATINDSAIIPWSTYSVAPDTFFEHVEVDASGQVTYGEATAAVEERLAFSNTIGLVAASWPAGLQVADDLGLTTAGNCALRRYRFRVIGNVDPEACGGLGESCGPFTVTFGLYDDCPGVGGQLIPGTGSSVTFSDDGEYEIGFIVSQDDDVLVPDRVWLATEFDRNNAGVIFAGPALRGFSDDALDFPGFPCVVSTGGFPQYPHASYYAEVFVEADCDVASPSYINARSTNDGFYQWGAVCIADDITLHRACDMVALEVGVRGAGRYDVELRLGSSNGPEGSCNSVDSFGLVNIPGTRNVFVHPSDTRLLKQFTFDQPIPLPAGELFVVLLPNNAEAGWLLTRTARASETETPRFLCMTQNGKNGIRNGSLQVVRVFTYVSCAPASHRLALAATCSSETHSAKLSMPSAGMSLS